MGLEEIKGIKLKGAIFDEETEISLLKPNAEPALGLVYGKNGAGKSTISRAFAKIKGENEETIEYAIAIDENSNKIVLTEEEKLRIHVFNEQYVDLNIKFRSDEDGLETIVVLGEDIVNENNLNNAQKSVDDYKPEVEKQQSICDNFKNEKSKESPIYYKKKIRESLKGEGAWGGRDARIKGNSRATSTYENTYKRFIKRKPQKKRDELITDFENKLNELNAAKSGSNKIEKSVKIDEIESFKFDEEKYIALLNKKIEKPELNEREQFLLALQIELGQEHPQKIKSFFNNTKNTRCPFCLQIVNDDYRKQLFKSIENVLNKAAEDHVKELSQYYLETVSFEYEPYLELDTKVLDKSRESLESLNECIREINCRINKKIDDIYTPQSIKNCDFNIRYKKYVDSLIELENERLKYNKKASETASIVRRLNQINSDITYYDIIEECRQYDKCLKEEEKEQEKLKKVLEEMNKREALLQGFKDKKRRSEIACKQINNDLSYIFFSNDRLSIEDDKKHYLIKSRNKSVSPSKISVGERNAIALCYFFSEIMKEQKEEDIYSNQYCIVIDDPVSSFDMENRVGILSFLKHQLKKYVSGNNKTKFVILTHDIQTAYDIEKIYGEITDFSGIDPRNRKKNISSLELINKNVREFESSKRNEYTRLMVNIYKYVKGINNDFELVVGNSMRRVLEAYGSFMYKKGIEQLSTTTEIMKHIPQNFVDHFENLMYRLVLHGGSHNEERVKSMVSNEFFDYISSEEKKRTGKEILVFLYLLDERHVLEHLKRDVDGTLFTQVELDLKAWKKEIENLI